MVYNYSIIVGGNVYVIYLDLQELFHQSGINTAFTSYHHNHILIAELNMED
jgi:hypothetical protein